MRYLNALILITLNNMRYIKIFLHRDLSIIMKRSVQRYVKSRIQFQKKYMRY